VKTWCLTLAEIIVKKTDDVSADITEASACRHQRPFFDANWVSRSSCPEIRRRLQIVQELFHVVHQPGARSSIGRRNAWINKTAVMPAAAARERCLTYVGGLGRRLQAVKQHEMTTCPTLSGAVWSVHRTTRHERWWGRSDTATKWLPEHPVHSHISSFWRRPKVESKIHLALFLRPDFSG